MEIVDSLTVPYGDKLRRIELCRGDLAELHPSEQLDILIVSAFPDSYEPTPPSLIGALHRRGVSVAELAKTRRFDLRSTFSCWLSSDLTDIPDGIGFKRILCFEPVVRGKPPEVVGDIFRCLAPFLIGEYPDATVAMPVVASGEQQWSGEDMLLQILRAAVHWLSQGLPLKCLKIVECVPEKVERLRGAFRNFESQTNPCTPAKSDVRYDAFISYSHRDRVHAHFVADTLRESNGCPRVFVDELTLNPGDSWQQAIYDTLDTSARIITLISPEYLQSKVCKEEFNIALMRNRESESSVLFPIYLKTAAPPTYMKMLQYSDCREADEEKLRRACTEICRRR
jgi:TIR domain-containing protein